MSVVAGVGKVNITPPVGIPMDGYAGRTDGAAGIRDELWARALYLASGQTECCLISVELLGLHRECVDRIRARIAEAAGIPEGHIMIAAAHTHSGPDCRNTERQDSLVARNLAATEDKIVGAAIWARRAAAPAKAYRLHTETVIGINRREWRDGRMVLGRNPEGPIDPSVDILHITDFEGNTRAVWFAHACHPVVMGSDNLWISGDFPGAASRFIEANTGGVALFANGATANINSSLRGTFADVDALGVRLGSAVVQALTRTREIEELPDQLSLRELEFMLPTEPVPDVAQAEEALARARQTLDDLIAAGRENRIHWARRNLRYAEEAAAWVRSGELKGGAPMRVWVAGIGDLGLVGVPAEVFVEIGLAVRQASPFPRTVVLSYVNGFQGYLPTAAAFAQGGYEIDVRIRHRGLAIAPEAAERVIDESVTGLESLRGVSP